MQGQRHFILRGNARLRGADVRAIQNCHVWATEVCHQGNGKRNKKRTAAAGRGAGVLHRPAEEEAGECAPPPMSAEGEGPSSVSQGARVQPKFLFDYHLASSELCQPIERSLHWHLLKHSACRGFALSARRGDIREVRYLSTVAAYARGIICKSNHRISQAASCPSISERERVL